MSPLAFAKPLKRRTVKAKARELTVKDVSIVRQAVFERDSYRCRETQAFVGFIGGVTATLRCTAKATDLHEIVFRSQGGNRTMENCVSLCHRHHMQIHSRKLWIVGKNANGPLTFQAEKPA